MGWNDTSTLDRIDDRYRILKKLGEGGFGTVYLAFDEQIQREVAIKVLNFGLASLEEHARKRLMREAQVLSKLKNAGIVEVYRLGMMPDGRPYVVLEYVDSEPLSVRLHKQGSLTCDEATGICIQVAEALAHAHELGILHRDIKPENILLTKNTDPPRVKLVDFGLGKLMMQAKSNQSNLTMTGTTVGSPHYMSPEQCRADELDGRTDIYSLGVVYFEMLTGTQAFAASDPALALLKQVCEPMPKLICVDPANTVPPALKQILDKCTAKNRGDRYENVQSLLSDLHDLQATHCQLRFKSAPRPSSRPSRKQPHASKTIWSIAGCLLVLLVLLLSVPQFLRHDVPQPPTKQDLTPSQAVSTVTAEIQTLARSGPTPNVLKSLRSDLSECETKGQRFDDKEERQLMEAYFALVPYGDRQSNLDHMVAHGERLIDISFQKLGESDGFSASQELMTLLIQAKDNSDGESLLKKVSDRLDTTSDGAGVAMKQVLKAELLLQTQQPTKALDECKKAVTAILSGAHANGNTWRFAAEQAVYFMANYVSIPAAGQDTEKLAQKWLDMTGEHQVDFRKAKVLATLAVAQEALGKFQAAKATWTHCKKVATEALVTADPAVVLELQAIIRNSDDHLDQLRSRKGPLQES
jgi:serine/threonine protein kinase